MTKKHIRLTKRQLAALARRYTVGESFADIAADYGVTPPTIANWLRGRVVSRAVSRAVSRHSPGSQSANPKYVAALSRLIADGVSSTEVARRFGVTRQAVSFILAKRAVSIREMRRRAKEDAT
ncbi:MAG: LysM peptidoglycan-binding domain-containing protein [Bradyrhizobium sp.]|nr:LysM peptidoglycan-binding domain-containing protein [Bradyrhizobium sp.]